jgi:signal transduction histidine kinase
MKLPLNPPQRFMLISLVLVTVMVIATSITQYGFYRQKIIERESAVIDDLVNAVVAEQFAEGSLSLSDLQHFQTTEARGHLEHSFTALEKLSGVGRIKVFNKDGKIAWSDEPKLVGSTFTRNWRELAKAFDGQVRAVFIPMATMIDPAEGLPQTELIEFYVPLLLPTADHSHERVIGVVALYRSSDKINAVIREGLILLWLVSGTAGAVLFGAIYALFRSVYFGQKAAESRLNKLSAEHDHMMQLEKLSAMGQLVSEIAHQLNNPLVGVVNLTQLAERESSDPARVRELLKEIRKAGQSCADFVQRMLAISRVGKSQPERMDLCEVARETIRFFVQSLGGHPPVEFESAIARADVHADPVLVRNALFNLIHNAAQADPAGKVRVQIVPRERGGVAGWGVAVSDSGPGIAADVKERVFEPFFTTRQGGTGLGLAVAQHIAIQHGGRIEADNVPGGGALFTFWLPQQA